MLISTYSPQNHLRRLLADLPSEQTARIYFTQAAVEADPYSRDFGNRFLASLKSSFTEGLFEAWQSVCGISSERSAICRWAVLTADQRPLLFLLMLAHLRILGRGDLLQALHPFEGKLAKANALPLLGWFFGRSGNPDFTGVVENPRFQQRSAYAEMSRRKTFSLTEFLTVTEQFKNGSSDEIRDLVGVLANAEAPLQITAELKDLLTLTCLAQQSDPSEASAYAALFAVVARQPELTADCRLASERVDITKRLYDAQHAILSGNFAALNRSLDAFERDEFLKAIGCQELLPMAWKLVPDLWSAVRRLSGGKLKNLPLPDESWEPLSERNAAMLRSLCGDASFPDWWTRPAKELRNVLSSKDWNAYREGLPKAVWVSVCLRANGLTPADGPEALPITDLIRLEVDSGVIGRAVWRQPHGWFADLLRNESLTFLAKLVSLFQFALPEHFSRDVLPYVGTKLWTAVFGCWRVSGTDWDALLVQAVTTPATLAKPSELTDLLRTRLSQDKRPMSPELADVACREVLYGWLEWPLVRERDNGQSWIRYAADRKRASCRVLPALWPRLSDDLREEMTKRGSAHLPPHLIPADLFERMMKGEQIPQYLSLARKPRTSWEYAARILSFGTHVKTAAKAVRGALPSVFKRSLRLTASLIAEKKPRDAAGLELLSLLGPDSADWIAGVLAAWDPAAEKGEHFNSLYDVWSVPKKSGGRREIEAPKMPLKLLQRRILDVILTPLGAHEAAHGFLSDRSILTNACRHVGCEVVVNADIHSCFPSVSAELVLGALRRDLGSQLLEPTLRLLTEVCTRSGVLPTGAPTSPMLLNRVLFKTDELLTAAAKARGVCYSRYADDITLSGGDAAVEMVGVAKGVLRGIGLELAEKKTNVFRRGRRQCCTGLVVNEQVSVPRTIRRRIRAEVDAFVRGRAPTWNGHPESAAQLRGRINYLMSVHPEEGRRLLEAFNRKCSALSQNRTAEQTDGGEA